MKKEMSGKAIRRIQIELEIKHYKEQDLNKCSERKILTY